MFLSIQDWDEMLVHNLENSDKSIIIDLLFCIELR